MRTRAGFQTVSTSLGGNMQKFLDGVRLRPDDVSLALFLAAVLYGMVLQTLQPAGLWGEMMKLADSIAQHGTFSNPFSILPTGPTAANPPLYPLILALFMKTLRYSGLVYIAITVSAAVMNAFTAVLLLRLSQIFYGDILPGVVASLLWIPVMPDMPDWDTSYTVAGLLLFCIVASSLASASIAKAALAGAIAGLLVLLNPSSLFVTLPWLAFLLWREGRLRPALVRAVTITFLVLAGFTVGWGWRNYRQLGAFVIRTNLGMTLYASNNYCAQPSMISNEFTGCYQRHHPNTSLEEATALRNLGEVRYDRLRTAETLSWINANPGKFWWLTLARVWQFWFPATEQLRPTGSEARREFVSIAWVQSWIAYRNFVARTVWLITVLSIPGFALMLRRKEPSAAFIAAALAAYPVLYYVVVSDVRYRYPVLWLSLLPAGYFLVSTVDRKRQSKHMVDRLNPQPA